MTIAMETLYRDTANSPITGNVMLVDDYETTTKIDFDTIADQIWEMMYEKPVLVQCPYCSSGNTFDSGNCIQCGAPI